MMKREIQIKLEHRDPLVVGNKIFKSSNDWELTEKEIERARIELGETDEKIRICLQELKNKLSKEGNYRTDDTYLLRFLRARKFNCEKAYQMVKYYYATKKKKPEFYGNPTELKYLKDFNYLHCLPYADEEGRIIYWFEIDSMNIETMSIDEHARCCNAFDDVVSMNPMCQVNGLIAVWNCKGIGIKHISKFLKKNFLIAFLSILHCGTPWRLKKIILLNTSGPTRFLYRLVIPTVSKKIAERVILLGSDLSELHQHINPAILPKQLGGALDIDMHASSKLVQDNTAYLEYDWSFTG